MSLSFQRKKCEGCKKMTFHRKPDCAPCLLCTNCQQVELAKYDKEAMKIRLLADMVRSKILPFPAWTAVTVGRN